MGIDKTYSLEFALQPPCITTVERPLGHPVVVRIRTYDPSGAEFSPEDELGTLFAQATLYDETGRMPLAPPDRYLLSGSLSRSVESVDAEKISRSYAIFSDIRINRPGRYRIGVSLFKIDEGRAISVGSQSGRYLRTGGGVSVEETISNIVEVHDGPTRVPRLGKYFW